MLTTYVLIALLASVDVRGRVIHFPMSAEFNDLQSCNLAANWLHDRDDSTLAYCAPKGAK